MKMILIYKSLAVLIRMKTCKWCLQQKLLQEFNKHPRMPDGHLNRCKTCEKEYKSEYYNKNKNLIKVKKAKYKEQYKLAKRTKEYRAIRNKSRRSRYKNDIQYKLSCVLRSRLKMALKGKAKEIKTLDSIGCSIQQLILHIEVKFQPGMSWDNYGEWHIDHIKPISLFKLPDELKLANHYTNLQPLWAEDNFKKGARYESCQKF